jgi:hypothetical protein
MFWTDAGSIYRASYDGADVSQIYAGGPTVSHTNHVELDPVCGKLFHYGFTGTTDSGTATSARAISTAAGWRTLSHPV